MNFSNEQIEAVLQDIYSGKISASKKLPKDLYLAISDYLRESLYKGFGGKLSSFALGGIDYELLTSLRENIYMFGAAKTYQQVKEMGGLVADAETFREFRDRALQVYDQYNVNWLKAEYNTSIGQAQQARQWVEIEKKKELFPYLRYVAVMDDNTSDICAPLDGTVLPVDDSLWNDYTPLNHFNCRCVLEQVSKYDDVELTSQSHVETLKENLNDTVQDAFKMNPGKDGYVFGPDHPYFSVAKGDKDFARENFGLDIPKKD